MNRTFATILIIAIVASTFIGVFAFSLISTDPPYSGGFRPYRSGPLAWGDVQGTLAMDFELTTTVQINQTSSGLFWSATDDVDGLEFCLTGRITPDVANVEATGVLNFEQKCFIAMRGTSITYRADALETKTLTPGWYKYVMVIWWDASGGGPPGVLVLNTLTWRTGLDDTSTAGHVYPDYVYVDHNRDGQWEAQVTLGGTVAFHVILGGYVPGVSNETIDTEKGLIATADDDSSDIVDTELANNTAIIGLLMLIIGFAFLAVGTKTNFAVVILGIIFLIIALLLIAWASFALYGGLTLLMAKKRRKRR